MKSTFFKFLAAVLPLSMLLQLAARPAVTVTTDKPEAIYQAGETVTFNISAREKGKPAAGLELMCFFRGAESLPAPQKLKLDADGQVQVRASLDCPGQVQIALCLPGEKIDTVGFYGKKVLKRYGAVFSPEKLLPAFPAPADFNEFWDKEKAAMQKLPLNAVIEPVKAPAGFKAYSVCLDAPEGDKAYGYLSMPADVKPGSLPIWLKVHGAGTYQIWPLFNKNAVIFSVHPHALPNGNSKKFYDESRKKLFKLANGRCYMYLNETDHTKNYFLGMIRRDYRAIQFLTSRPEWNGRDFVVNGRSQGGAQALICGGLEPRITVVLSQEPGLCDLGAFKAGRVSGWPYSNPVTRRHVNVEKLLTETSYFDAVNFARNIKNAKCVVTTGFSDITCIATGVYAAFNVIPAKDKKMFTNPRFEHGSKWPKEAYTGNVVRFKYGKREVLPF